MRKIKAFGCIFLVIALMMVFLLAGFPKVATAYTQTDEDSAFTVWIANFSSVMVLTSDILISAAENQDYEQQYYCYDVRYRLSENALEEIDQFDVSPEMQPVKDEFESVLLYTSQAAYYGKRWVMYSDSDDFNAYVMYEKFAIEYLEDTLDLAKKVMASTPSPGKDSDGDGVPDEHDYAPNDPNVQTKSDAAIPGFGAIFAIGSLLAVAYLVLRRKK